MKVDNNHVVSLHYTLTNDQGDELDSSAGRDPLQYLHGGEGIIPGLEKELSGKAPGDKFVVTIQPEEAYGESNPDLVTEVPLKQFGADTEVKPGMSFQAQGPDGQAQIVTIRKVEGDTVTVDMNHPLAGEVLHFDVSVEDVRAATDDEIQQGHPG